MKRLIKRKSGGSNPDNELMEMFEAFAQSANDDNFKSGQDVYIEFIKLNPEQQKQFISNIQSQAPQDEEGEYNEQMQVGGLAKDSLGRLYNREYDNIYTLKGTNQKYFYNQNSKKFIPHYPELASKLRNRLKDDDKPLTKEQANAVAFVTKKMGNPTLRNVGEDFDISDLVTGYKEHYNPLTNKISVKDNSLGDYLEELGHAKQKNTKGLNLLTLLKERVVNEDPYETEGTIEHEAHNIINEDMYKELSDLTEKKKQVGGTNKSVKGSSDAVRKYQQMLNDKYGANLVIDGVWGKNTQSLYNRYLKEKTSNVKPLESQQVLTTGNMDKLLDFHNRQVDSMNNYNKPVPLPKWSGENDTVESLKNVEVVSPKKIINIKQESISTYNPNKWSGADSNDTPTHLGYPEYKPTKLPARWSGENQMRQVGGIPETENGYYELNPYENPIAKIPSNKITMKGLKYNIRAVGGSGKDYGEMLPDQEYSFPDEEYMYEIPKLQAGGRSPRRVETEKEKQARLAKYKKPPMNINALLGKKDNNIPFANKPVTPKTVQQVKDNNQPFVQGKKPPLVKKKSVTSNVKGNPNTGMRTAKDFMTEFGKKELEKQSLEKESNVTPIDTSLYAKDILNHKDELVKDKTKALDLPFVQLKPISMDFDNPYEANAIAYKKLKNASVMSPYKGSVNLQTPELYQESITPYVNNIREQRNAVLQQLNPNSTSGQSVLANIYGQGIAQENEAVSNVGRNNAKFTTDWLAQKAETRNRQQQLDYDMNNKYSADVAQLQATQDENDINYMNSISEMNAKRLQARNAMIRTAMETGIGDALDIKDNSFTFDVNKLPRNFYSKETNPDNTGTKRQLGKIINIKGIPYESYLDENGKAVMRKVEVQQVGGKSNKYKINLANKAY